MSESLFEATLFGVMLKANKKEPTCFGSSEPERDFETSSSELHRGPSIPKTSHGSQSLPQDPYRTITYWLLAGNELE